MLCTTPWPLPLQQPFLCCCYYTFSPFDYRTGVHTNSVQLFDCNWNFFQKLFPSLELRSSLNSGHGTHIQEKPTTGLWVKVSHVYNSKLVFNHLIQSTQHDWYFRLESRWNLRKLSTLDFWELRNCENCFNCDSNRTWTPQQVERPWELMKLRRYESPFRYAITTSLTPDLCCVQNFHCFAKIRTTWNGKCSFKWRVVVW